MRAIQAFGDFGFPVGCAAVLLVQSDRPGHVADDLTRYAGLLAAAGAVEVAVADDAQESEALLAGRRVMSTAFEALGGRLAEDVCVPVRRLGDFVAGIEAIASRRGVTIPVSGHAGDGNLHPSIVFARDDPDSLARAWEAFDEVIRLGLSLGGTITGEHGIGSVKVPWLGLEVGQAELDRQRRLKAVFDPAGIMNPGKVFAR